MSFAGTRCMDRWDEGSWDTDPYRHGRFTIIVNRGYKPLYSDKPDAWLAIPSKDYPAHDARAVHPNLALFGPAQRGRNVC